MSPMGHLGGSQSVKSALGSSHDLRILGSSLTSGCLLSGEPLPLPFCPCPSPLCLNSVSNKILKKKKKRKKKKKGMPLKAVVHGLQLSLVQRLPRQAWSPEGLPSSRRHVVTTGICSVPGSKPRTSHPSLTPVSHSVMVLVLQMRKPRLREIL